jgi:hypothetical protein
MTAIRLFSRLRRMSASEVAARTETRLRHQVERLSWSWARPAWHRRDLAGAFDPGHETMRPIVERLEAADFARAQAGLAAHFADRAPPFVLAPQHRAGLARAILGAFPGAAEDAERRGNRILAGRLDLLGYRNLNITGPAATAGASIDWHRDPVHDRRPPHAHWTRVPYLDPACGDHKIIWELNRHQHWLALGRAYVLTGEVRYRKRFVAELSSWMAANPPLTGVNWSSMLELSLRCLSWIWALHLFVQREEPESSDAWLVDLLLGIDRQLSLVAQNLSTYFSPNTHLLGEALALYVASQSLPELARARQWGALGRDTLIRQAEAQIGTDGGHVELSPHYHRYALDFYLLALAVARASGDTDGARTFEPSVRALARFARAMADDALRLPRIGDDDGGMLMPMCGRDVSDIRDSLALAAVLTGAGDLFDGDPPEEVAWMCGAVPPRIAASFGPRSTALAGSGYFVSRTDRGDHLVMDAGPLGFLNSGHAHADALAMTLEVAGVPLLIDPGTGCYTVNPETRDRFRSTAYHNTVTVNGRSQSIPAGPFHWASAAHETVHAWRSDTAFDFCEASHDGYLPTVHRRQVLARPGCWVIWDWLLGPGTIEAAAHWHLAPSWSASIAERAVCLDHPGGKRMWLRTIGADVNILTGESGGDGLGWCSPTYGAVVPTTTIRAVRSGASPFVIVTVLIEAREAPAVEALPVSGHNAAAIEWRGRSWREVAMARDPVDFDRRTAIGDRSEAGGVESDARVACVREHGNGPVELWMVDGSTVANRGGRRLVQLPVAVPTLHLVTQPALSASHREPTASDAAGPARSSSRAGRAVPAGR